jgi:trk system potassium uptake protein TrkH
LTPRIYNTARSLYLAYIFLTLVCTVCYFLAGMSWYDALAHSLTTISTGGFSPHDASLGYYDSYAIEVVADLFMLISALSFGLHFRFLRGWDLNLYWNDEETRWYLMIIAGSIIAMMVYLRSADVCDTWLESLRFAAFEVIAYMTSTGFAATDVPSWPPAAIVFLIILAYIGGCAGSTAGGSKVVRICIAIKSVLLDMKRLLHPNAVFTLKYNGQSITSTITSAVSAFLLFNIVITVILTCLLMATGLDFLTAMSAVAACLNVLGPAVGELGANYQPVNDVGTWILTVAMVMGRLDLFTIIVLFFPSYWRG